ncbi:MAG: transposase [Candidatus Endonucleobacter bathymodioli]|uniref:Transposase n=1 Tax=Candidatus Endonucleibacter bathymodioli TaxID=539814 RepID=A0AA90NNZ0_9GAMM|nr:transposase [Candidatus Endonucleobacter bathymodioli]
MSDHAVENALRDIQSMRVFVGLSLNGTIPGHTTIMNFRHLLERHDLVRKIFNEVNDWLSDAGVLVK